VEEERKMYRIVVPVKQVPDMERVRFDTVAGRVDRSSAAGVVNPVDLNALEAALRVRDQYGGTVTVISMGPQQAVSSLRECLARGADRAVLLADRAFAGADTWATSYTLSAAIRKLGGCDLVICGEKTVDGDTGQVGPELAEWLGIPHVAYVREIVSIDTRLKALVDMSDGLYIAETSLPVLLTVTRKGPRPRYATPAGIFGAVAATVGPWGAEELRDVADTAKLGLRGSPTRLTKVVVPPLEGRKGERLDGGADEAVAQLLQRLETGGIL
jgi:electron transfer flavoprotein beta subunit